jgi:hypothetical protein
MDKADAGSRANGQPLLSPTEWRALKGICGSGKGKV